MTQYLSVESLIYIHDEQIERYGGMLGIRDEGLLEAAVMRPQSGYYEDIIAEAAALWESLAQNHPFLDGNKRTSCEAVELFLKINGIEIVVGEGEILGFLKSCYYGDGEPTHQNFDKWLRENTR